MTDAEVDPKAYVGMCVHVWSADHSEDWGYGIIREVGGLTPTYPARIDLADGRVTEGVECWWASFEMAESALVKSQREVERLKAELARHRRVVGDVFAEATTGLCALDVHEDAAAVGRSYLGQIQRAAMAVWCPRALAVALKSEAEALLAEKGDEEDEPDGV